MLAFSTSSLMNTFSLVSTSSMRPGFKRPCQRRETKCTSGLRCWLTFKPGIVYTQILNMPYLKHQNICLGTMEEAWPSQWTWTGGIVCFNPIILSPSLPPQKMSGWWVQFFGCLGEKLSIIHYDFLSLWRLRFILCFTSFFFFNLLITLNCILPVLSVCGLKKVKCQNFAHCFLLFDFLKSFPFNPMCVLMFGWGKKRDTRTQGPWATNVCMIPSLPCAPPPQAVCQWRPLHWTCTWSCPLSRSSGKGEVRFDQG